MIGGCPESSTEVMLLHDEAVSFQNSGDIGMAISRFELAYQAAAGNDEIAAEIHNRWHMASLLESQDELTRALSVLAPVLKEARYRTEQSIDDLCAAALFAVTVTFLIPLRRVDIERSLNDFERLFRSSLTENEDPESTYHQIESGLILLRVKLLRVIGQTTEANKTIAKEVCRLPGLYLVWSRVCLELGNFEEAVRCLALVPDTLLDEYSEAMLLADIAVKRKDLCEALHQFRTAKNAILGESQADNLDEMEYDILMLQGDDISLRMLLARHKGDRRSESLWKRKRFLEWLGDYHLVTLAERQTLPRFLPNVDAHEPDWPTTPHQLDIEGARLAQKAARHYERLARLNQILDERLQVQLYHESAIKRMKWLKKLGYK
jgi:hypothetical protein